MKKILQFAFWLLVFTGVLVVFGFATREQKSIRCSLVRIDITENTQNGFIDEDEIKNIITGKADSLEGTILDSINATDIESRLNKNPYISGARAVKTLLGELIVEAERHKPEVRVIATGGDSFYLSNAATVMPLSATYVPRIIIASGHIPVSEKEMKELAENGQDPLQHQLLKKIHHLACRINAHPYLSRHIEQIFVNDKNEFELVPASGDHYIVVGSLENLNRKFQNLLAFYQAGMPKMKEKGIREINLKFNNQVVCKK